MNFITYITALGGLKISEIEEEEGTFYTKEMEEDFLITSVFINGKKRLIDGVSPIQTAVVNDNNFDGSLVSPKDFNGQGEFSFMLLPDDNQGSNVAGNAVDYSLAFDYLTKTVQRTMVRNVRTNVPVLRNNYKGLVNSVPSHEWTQSVFYAENNNEYRLFSDLGHTVFDTYGIPEMRNFPLSSGFLTSADSFPLNGIYFNMKTQSGYNGGGHLIRVFHNIFTNDVIITLWDNTTGTTHHVSNGKLRGVKGGFEIEYVSGNINVSIVITNDAYFPV